jgi:hypothetical protein
MTCMWWGRALNTASPRVLQARGAINVRRFCAAAIRDVLFTPARSRNVLEKWQKKDTTQEPFYLHYFTYHNVRYRTSIVCQRKRHHILRLGYEGFKRYKFLYLHMHFEIVIHLCMKYVCVTSCSSWSGIAKNNTLPAIRGIGICFQIPSVFFAIILLATPYHVSGSNCIMVIILTPSLPPRFLPFPPPSLGIISFLRHLRRNDGR